MAWMYQALTYSLSGFGPTSVVLCRAGRWLLEKRKPTYQPTRLISNMMSTDITWELSKHPLLISPQILLSLFVDVRFVHSIRRILGLHLLVIKGTQKFFSSSSCSKCCMPTVNYFVVLLQFCRWTWVPRSLPSTWNQTRLLFLAEASHRTVDPTAPSMYFFLSVTWPFQTSKYQLSPY